MAKQPKTKDGKLVLISGASRSGKTVFAMQRYRHPTTYPVVFVFDLENQWTKGAGFKHINSLRDLMRIAINGDAGRYAFVPPGNDLKAEFEAFCQCVWHFAEFFGECVLIGEEMAELAGASKASGTWGRIIRGGLKRGITIVPIIQSWAEGDKTCMRNASEFVVFRMPTAGDIEYMSKKTRIPLQEMEGLKPLEYLIYDTTEFTVTRGKITFK